MLLSEGADFERVRKFDDSASSQRISELIHNSKSCERPRNLVCMSLKAVKVRMWFLMVRSVQSHISARRTLFVRRLGSVVAFSGADSAISL